MSTNVHALTETNGRTGFVIAIFFDEVMALDVARSHANARVRRCVASGARLQDGNPNPDSYTIHVHLPTISGRLAIKTFEDRIEDGFGLVRTDVSPPVEVAVIHDGSDRGVGEAADYARLLALAPVMLRLITDALGAWAEQFDGLDSTDLSVSGNDLVDWLGTWRSSARTELMAANQAGESVP